MKLLAMQFNFNNAAVEKRPHDNLFDLSSKVYIFLYKSHEHMLMLEALSV